MADSVLDHVFTVEGWPKFTNDPADRGGPTKGGITLATLRSWRGKPVTVDDLRNLGKPEAGDIYQSMFIGGFAGINDDLLRLQVVDSGILHGPARATAWLQEAVGVKADGKIGPVTLRSVNSLSPHVIGIRFAARRIRFIGALIEAKRDQAKWAGGWSNRATSFLDKEADRGNVTAPQPSTEVRA